MRTRKPVSLGFTARILPTTLLMALALAPRLHAQIIPNPSFEVDHHASVVGYASESGGVITGRTLSSPGFSGLNLNGTINTGLFADNGAIPDGTNAGFTRFEVIHLGGSSSAAAAYKKQQQPIPT